ncbi:MAG: hypothetical protein MI741_07580 [Rhodospirillales bacterium]|nr:hypothetical protein [Rhodospirillales bacterium]
MRLLYTYAVTLCAGLALFAFAGMLLPELNNMFLTEGGLLENLKLALFFSGALVGLITLLIYKRRRLATYYWIVPVFCLLGCFEEIGYGSHLIDNDAYPVVLDVHVNSFHSLNRLAWVAWQHAGLGVIEALLALAALAVATRPLITRHRKWIFSAFETNPSTTYLLLAVVLLLPIIYIHNFAWNTPTFGLIERELELGLALTMLFAALAGPSTVFRSSEGEAVTPPRRTDLTIGARVTTQPAREPAAAPSTTPRPVQAKLTLAGSEAD